MSKDSWPLQPYRGFSYYTRTDAPLFAGREDDTIRCARFLADCETRILILHGSTGCGKSSFLRAGLIPFLETGDIGFRFIRSAPGSQSKAVFVRSTDAPLCRLSESLYDFISRPLEDMTPRGPQTLRLTEKITHYTDCSSFCDNIAASVDEMLIVLHKLAKTIPQTLVLIIDQAEEVLTLKPGQDGERSRSRFFEFLTRFQDKKLDMKLLIAIRTEYIGRFDNEVQNQMGDFVAIPHYLLTDLTESRIVEAIERPTLQKDIGDYGNPYSHYNFSYEDGLPKEIAEDLLIANPRGGILPVLQIVCDRLYRSITNRRERPDSKMVITKDDYIGLGGIEGQVEAYVSEIIATFCAKHGISRERAIKKEIERWKHVLYLLTKEQLDGTATTQIKSADELMAEATKQFCELDFDPTMDYLSQEEQRVLRREEITNIAKNQRVVCYSLGHDAIGLALQKWKYTHRQSKIYRTRLALLQGTTMFGRYLALLIGALFVIPSLALAIRVAFLGIEAMSSRKRIDGDEAFTFAVGIIVNVLISWWMLHLSGFLPSIRQSIRNLWKNMLRGFKAR